MAAVSSSQMRIFLGFVAGALSVLIFHQGMVLALHASGLLAMAPFRTTLVPPLMIPAIVSLCFWGGLYGAVFGALLPRFRLPLWVCGIITGMIAVLVGWFIVAPLKGNPVAAGWQAWPMARSLMINGVWGLGLGVLLPVLAPRLLHRHTARATT